MAEDSTLTYFWQALSPSPSPKERGELDRDFLHEALKFVGHSLCEPLMLVQKG